MNRDDIDRSALAERLRVSRARSLQLAAPLSAEDAGAQAMPDASPTKWHLAHTTWFYATFVLRDLAPAAPEDAQYLFNSYYEAVGPRHARPARGLITRPSLEEVLGWRARVDASLERFCLAANAEAFAAARPLIELGLAHEEQHQELMLTDILALFAAHPSCPAYRSEVGWVCGGGPENWLWMAPERAPWVQHDGGLVEIGAGHEGFAFDSERPRHKVWLEPFEIAERFVTIGEWYEFMVDGGYQTASLWLSDGWDCVQREGWNAPGYWRWHDGAWSRATLHGRLPIDDDDAPVSHVSYWEADAYARWAGARLPREAEWEAVAQSREAVGRFQDAALRPLPEDHGSFFGSVWVWTQSPFVAYPGFKAESGAVGEYNGKFMAGQYVLRGGSCVTPPDHVRASYRNFFQPEKRWQFTGLRLARDI